MSDAAAELLLRGLRALGDLPTSRELALMAEALLRGPDDLRAELELAAGGGAAGRAAWRRLWGLLDARGAQELSFTALNLVTEVGRR
jgi:hypothetical protein